MAVKEKPIRIASTPLHQWQTSSHMAELAPISVEQLVPEGHRAVIIAPHPDDEVLGCGGLLQGLAALGRAIQLDSSPTAPGSPGVCGAGRWSASAGKFEQAGPGLHRLACRCTG